MRVLSVENGQYKCSMDLALKKDLHVKYDNKIFTCKNAYDFCKSRYFLKKQFILDIDYQVIR